MTKAFGKRIKIRIADYIKNAVCYISNLWKSWMVSSFYKDIYNEIEKEKQYEKERVLWIDISDLQYDGAHHNASGAERA